ncbi:uncharacterized protein LOC119494940 [Sebastes umbrosus]|uniref:uncharacterized protein LOC119494940 n=1 Tax=Sebastes umbrosus TaxID=72105 RepID=UPI00189C638F|nr:uncharacterized protein LOC119494940 [Sebastes umbrosus]
MAPQTCRFCGAAMDIRDGHRECPSCLGMAHLMDDVDCPCPAAIDLPLEERARRARLEGHSQHTAAAAPPSRERERRTENRSRKRKQGQSQGHGKKRATETNSPPLQSPAPPVDGAGGQEVTQCQILAAIRGLADRVSRMEAQRAAPLTAACSEGISPRDLPAYEEHQTDHPDAISLYAQVSLLEDEGHPEIAEESHCLSLSHTGESASVDDGTGDSVPSDVFSKVLSAAKIMGLSSPTETPSSSEGVWAGISQSRPSVTIPAAEDYCQMLRRSWNNPGSAPQFNSGCRRLAKAQYPHESGLGDMPPVEREMAALTPLGPDRVTTNPHCPRKECKKTDHLVCRSYNAAARAARAGNALALLLAALRRTASAGDQDTRNLIDAALSTHSQLTRDIGSAMSSAMMARRQIWLAQTTLPENIRKELTNMPVVPGARAQVHKVRVMLQEDCDCSIKGFSPGLQQEGLLKGDAPPRVQGPKGPLHRSGGAAAKVHSQLRLDSWEKEVSDPWVVATVARGYRIQFRRRPPPFSRVQMTLVKDPVQAKVLSEEIAILLQKKVIAKVRPSEQQAGFYSTYFLVPKKDGGIRPILDLRRLNTYIKVLPFRMLHTRHILESIEQGEWFTTIDLKDAYFHVPICRAHWQFLRFAFQGQAYEFKVLPFGLSLSPRVFTRVVAAALSPLQRAGLKILPYLDDWLVCASSREQVMQHTGRVLAHVQSLGFRVNLKKSNLEPRQETVFLGLCLNSLMMKASLTPQRVARILTVLRIFRLGKRLQLVHFQRLLGLISAAVLVIPLGLLRARPLQRWLNAFNLHPRRDRHVKLRVTQSCQRALSPWRDHKLLTQGVPLGNLPSRRTLVSTDASMTGWGAVWEGRMARGVWKPPWDTEHINVLELRAVHLALRAFLPFIRGRHVLVKSDSSAAVYHVNHQGGTKSLRCLKVAQRLLPWAFPRLASLKAVYVPGVLNRAADLLSRSGPLPGEWRLHPEVVASLSTQFGMAQVDLFASKETAHCQLWFSLRPPGGPLGLDALSHEWPKGLLYAFPPLPLIPHVLDRINRGHYKVLLVAPRWPGRHWFPALLRLVHGRPWPLPLRADLLSQAGGKIWYPKPAVMQLWAWPLLSPSLMT